MEDGISRGDETCLAHLPSAKHLNFHPARWSLFFGRLTITITYSSQVVKPDAFSHQFSPTAEQPESIVPSDSRRKQRPKIQRGRTWRKRRTPQQSEALNTHRHTREKNKAKHNTQKHKNYQNKTGNDQTPY